jgi:hypothetical protein
MTSRQMRCCGDPELDLKTVDQSDLGGSDNDKALVQKPEASISLGVESAGRSLTDTNKSRVHQGVSTTAATPLDPHVAVQLDSDKDGDQELDLKTADWLDFGSSDRDKALAQKPEASTSLGVESAGR